MAALQFGTIIVVGGGCYGSYYARQLRRARAAGKVGWRDLVVVDRDAACRVASEIAGDATARIPRDAGAAHDGPWDSARVVVREWTSFFAEYLAGAVAQPDLHARDTVVPSPLIPHLLFEWLRDRARARPNGADIVGDVPGELADVPWQRPGTDGTRYVSYATWTCPVNCIEPKKCPHTGGARDWSFHTSLVPLARASTGAASAARMPAADVGPHTAVLRVTHRTFGVGMIDVADVVAADTLVARSLEVDGAVRVATASHCHGAVAGLRRVAASM